MKTENTIFIKSIIIRFLVGFFSIALFIVFMFIKPSIVGAIYFFLILLVFPLPLALFGRFPPNGRPDLPFGYLNRFEKLEALWSEITLPAIGVIFFIFSARFFGIIE